MKRVCLSPLLSLSLLLALGANTRLASFSFFFFSLAFFRVLVFFTILSVLHLYGRGCLFQQGEAALTATKRTRAWTKSIVNEERSVGDDDSRIYNLEKCPSRVFFSAAASQIASRIGEMFEVGTRKRRRRRRRRRRKSEHRSTSIRFTVSLPEKMSLH